MKSFLNPCSNMRIIDLLLTSYLMLSSTSSIVYYFGDLNLEAVPSGFDTKFFRAWKCNYSGGHSSSVCCGSDSDAARKSRNLDPFSTKGLSCLSTYGSSWLLIKDWARSRPSVTAPLFFSFSFFIKLFYRFIFFGRSFQKVYPDLGDLHYDDVSKND